MPKTYKGRTDLENVQSQWNKLAGLHAPQEASAAIVRAATATELAANFAIRKEFEARCQFTSEFVNSLLRWANGLAGKCDHLLIPLSKGEQHKHKTITALKSTVDQINSRRNNIVHQGEFSNARDATTFIEQAKDVVESLVQLYEPTFLLKHGKEEEADGERRRRRRGKKEEEKEQKERPCRSLKVVVFP